MSESVSIIVCTSSTVQQRIDTLRSLGRLVIPAGIEAELILVENHTNAVGTPLSEEVFQNGLSVKRLAESRVGKCYALNTAMASTAKNILAFTDDDLMFPSDWLKNLIEPIIAGKADAVVGRIRLAPVSVSSTTKVFTLIVV